MDFIIITEGSFPNQKALLSLNSILMKNYVLSVKNENGDEVLYDLKTAVTKADIILQKQIEYIIRIELRDGTFFIARTDQRMAKQFEKAAKSPKKQSDLYKEVIPKKSMPNPAGLFLAWYQYQSRGSRFLLICIAIMSFFYVYLSSTQGPSRSPDMPAARPAPPQPLTPEEIAAQAAENERQQKLALQRQGSATINEVQGYETFLTEDEAYYRENPASNADLEKIRKTLVLFSGMAESIDKARQIKSTLSKEDAALLKKIEVRLSGLQQKTLPGLRKAFGRQADQLLWEYNVDVLISGTTINFISGMFAANSNIKATHQQIEEILTKLRFKQVRYSWYKGSEYQYYTLKTPADAKIAMFKFGEFRNLTK